MLLLIIISNLIYYASSPTQLLAALKQATRKLYSTACARNRNQIKMKLINKSIERDMTGFITLFPEEPEDMWHAFNLIRPGDRLRANAIRRVTLETKTGSTSSQRVQTVLTIQVDRVDFDAQAGQLHLNGRVCEENKYVAVGSHHTLDLDLFRNFTIIKAEWDSVTLGVVKDACDAGERSEIGAVVLQEGMHKSETTLFASMGPLKTNGYDEGVANVCFITDHMTILRQKVEIPVPRKRKGIVSNYEKGLEKFYDATYQSIIRHFDFATLKVILLASPGFVAEGLRNYIFATAMRTDAKAVIVAKPKFVVVHCNSGHIHSLNEVLKSPAVAAKLTDTKFAKETRAVEKFFQMMNTDEDRAWYGPKEVAKAIEKGAVGTLLVSNSLFRSNNIGERRRHVKMVEDVKKSGGETLVLSSIHESGIRLDGLGGIAAILTFPLQDLDEDIKEDEEIEEINN